MKKGDGNLNNSLKIRLKSAIFSKGMLVSVILGLAILMRHALQTLIVYNVGVGPLSFKKMCSLYLEEIYIAHAMNGFDIIAPILAVLPASTMFCNDYGSGYIKSILGRVDKCRYFRETVFCSSIAGGLAIFIPVFIMSMIFMINGEPNIAANKIWQNGIDETVFASIQYIWGGGFIVMLLLILAFMFGAVWSNIGLCVSAIFPNKYITLLGPFFIYFSLHLILYRTPNLLFLSPLNTLIPIETFVPSVWFPFVYQIVLFTVCIFLFYHNTERRIENV